MGRFGDLWKSGKLTVSTKQPTTTEEGLSNEVVSMMQDVSPEFGLTDASHVVLSALRSRRGLETGRWLNTLVTESGGKQPEAPASTPAQSEPSFEEMTHWMDSLFRQLGELTFEFNKTAVNSNLLVTVEPPQAHEIPSDQAAFATTKIYRGRMTTSQWAMGVCGRPDKISIYLIPAALLLAFTAGQLSERDYPPFMEIVRVNVDGRLLWTVGGQLTPVESIPYLAKELLGDLIRVASGVMSESELFSAGTEKPKLGENLAVGYSSPQAQQPSNAPATTSSAGIADAGDSAISDACDLVDEAVERELKALYEQASKLKPDSDLATPTRTKISNLERFRSQMLAAFEEYTHVGQKSAEQKVQLKDLL